MFFFYIILVGPPQLCRYAFNLCMNEHMRENNTKKKGSSCFEGKDRIQTTIKEYSMHINTAESSADIERKSICSVGKKNAQLSNTQH